MSRGPVVVLLGAAWTGGWRGASAAALLLLVTYGLGEWGPPDEPGSGFGRR